MIRNAKENCEVIPRVNEKINLLISFIMYSNLPEITPVSDTIGIRKSQFYPFVSGIMGIEFFRFRPPVSIAIGKYFEILHPCF